MEILIVVAILASLMAMVVLLGPKVIHMGKRAKITTQLELIQNGLKRYRAEFAEYPKVANGSTDPKTMAGCLYQALTGDGSDRIHGAPAASSTGNPGATTNGEVFLEEARFNPKKPKNGFVHKDYYLQDPYQDPYRYRKAEEGLRTNQPDYDLWSVANDKEEKNPTQWKTNWD